MSIRFVIIVAAALAASACEKTAGQAAGPGGGRAGGRGGRGSAVATETTTVQRMSVQRQVDLSGTLLSPDQAKISS